VLDANIYISNPDGVKKGDLVLALGRYLYGLESDSFSALVCESNAVETAGPLV